MYIENYDHKFVTSKNRLIYVQTKLARKFGEKLHAQILKKWAPPCFFYHFLDGGHVAAAQKHVTDSFFLKLDLLHFFDAIGRSRIYRTMRRFNFNRHFSWDTACHSTVKKGPTSLTYTLPFGFVQSPILASISLASSDLGIKIEGLYQNGLNLSVYMDDIILSSNDERQLIENKILLEKSAEISGFSFNKEKSIGPSQKIEAFNINISKGFLEVTAKRMHEFEIAIENAIKDGRIELVKAIINYLNNINNQQGYLLKSKFL